MFARRLRQHQDQTRLSRTTDIPLFDISSSCQRASCNMPPRLNLFSVRAPVPVLRQPSTPIATALNTNRTYAARGITSSSRTQRRWNSSGSGGKNDSKLNSTTKEQLPHVSEEAAEMRKIMDKKCDGTAASPELEQGTPIQEVSS